MSKAIVLKYLTALDSVEGCRGHILNFDEQCPVFRCLNDKKQWQYPG